MSTAPRVIIVHGYEGSGTGHWQRWLEAELCGRAAAVAFPDLPAPAAPQKDAWVAALAAEVAAGDGAPVVFVCHSLGCWAVDHLLAERRVPEARAALLVAPPSPLLPFEPIDSFLPPPRRAEAWTPLAARTLVVASDNDAYVSAEEAVAIAAALGAAVRLLPGAGHINVEAGYGPWPFALAWLRSVGALSG